MSHSESHVALVAAELGATVAQVRAAAAFLDEGATVPFLARYRKEATGSLDEVALATVRDRLARLAELDDRRGAIVRSLSERGLLSPELKEAVRGAPSMAVLEDLYLPFRPKRRTRATAARELGLEPLAARVFLQDPGEKETPLKLAERASAELGNGVDADQVLSGTRDIIAEWVSEDAEVRGRLRQVFLREGVLESRVARGKEVEGSKFRDYFEWQERVGRAPSHRVLAVFRGESEGVLRVRLAPSPEKALAILERRFVRGRTPFSEQVRAAVTDAYARLLGPSLETETRRVVKERADQEAIRVFAANLRDLLLAPPLGQKVVLAVDPGFRTGCKTVVLDRQGSMLHNETIFPHLSQGRRKEAGERVLALVSDYGVEAVAVGDGTAGRETEVFLRSLGLPLGTPVVMVSESGASIYSASEAAREEFPDQDVTVRGAVSIGRRLLDPLAELVKIDPKSIGVGQYQHDVDQQALRRSLDDVVVSCVNSVGVNANTASRQLLIYVSGLGPTLADNLIRHRDEHGPFHTRKDLLKVPRLGPKAFQQCAGFLRITGGDELLDAGAVHPESYPVIRAMARDLDCEVIDLMSRGELRARIDLQRYVNGSIGLPTLVDILDELAQPGRDPRLSFAPFSFAAGVQSLDDLEVGMRLPGVVTNVTAFGAFVDVGVHHDGLVHISELADRFVRDPAEIVRVRQPVEVTVLAVDRERRRISLSMKTALRN